MPDQQENMAQVTVLIPAHNAAATLAQTLDSLTQQHFRDFAVLVANDASTDHTAAIAHSYADRLQIDVLPLEQNVAVAGAERRTGTYRQSPTASRATWPSPASVWHYRARRMPLNCQRAPAGKKLR